MFKKLIKINSLAILISTLICSTVSAQFRPDRPTFFEDGQRFMEDEIRKLEQQQNQNNNQSGIEHPSQLLTVDDGKLTWEKYIFKAQGFSVWMPSGISSEEVVQIDTPQGRMDFEVVAKHPKSLRFITAYSDTNNIRKFRNTQELLTAVKNGIIQRSNFKLLTDKNITFENYPGQYLVMEDPSNKEVIYFHIYVINNQVYVLGVGTKSAGYENDIESFFDSFRLL